MKGRCLQIEEENTKLLAEVQQLNATLELKTKENDEMQNIKVYNCFFIGEFCKK